MRHSFIDKYSYLESPLHRINPSIKIMLTFLFLILLLVLPVKWTGIAFSSYFLFLLFLIYLSKVPFTFVLKRALIIIPFLGFILILNALLEKGNIASIYTISSRSFLSIMTLILLVSTTNFSLILKTLSKWHMPYVLIIILSFMYHYFFILTDEIEKMVRAINLRYHKKNRIGLFRIYTHIVGFLFIKSYSRAERVYYAMTMRGFDIEKGNI